MVETFGAFGKAPRTAAGTAALPISYCIVSYCVVAATDSLRDRADGGVLHYQSFAGR